MSTFLKHQRARSGWRAMSLLFAACLTLLTVNAYGKTPTGSARAVTAGSHKPIAKTSQTLARELSSAHWNVRQARRVLNRKTAKLKRCVRNHGAHSARCRSARRAAHAAARRLAHAKRRIIAISRLLAHAKHAATQSSLNSGASATGAGSQTSAGSTAPGGRETTFEMGAVAGSAQLYELPWLQQLGAHTARMELPINTSVATLEPIVAGYAKAGIRPLLMAGFNNRIPSEAETQNLAKWALAFGPSGTFWKGKTFPPNTVVTNIEFGNETNNPYQFGESSETWYDDPSFIHRAEDYARRLKSAQIAISASGAPVGLLGIGDQYGGHKTWVEAMFRAVPDLGRRVSGWTVHPYGRDWRTPIDNLINGTQARGAPSSLPIYVTEWGLSTDNGRCLSNNFGWNPCMTYAEAATTLGSTVSAMRAQYGARLRAFYLFQARDQQPSGASSNREHYFGALQSNRAAKGAYTAEVQSLFAANP